MGSESNRPCSLTSQRRRLSLWLDEWRIYKALATVSDTEQVVSKPGRSDAAGVERVGAGAHRAAMDETGVCGRAQEARRNGVVGCAVQSVCQSGDAG